MPDFFTPRHAYRVIIPDIARSACNVVHMQSTMRRDPLLQEVRAGLARHGYTQTDLAEQLHTSRAAVSRRMSGEVAFDYRELRTISKFLKVPVSVLYGEVSA